jgi:hypothetical protein
MQFYWYSKATKAMIEVFEEMNLNKALNNAI